MPDLLDFMTAPPPFVKGSDTSMAAATAIEPHLNRLQKRVYDAIADKGAYGRTDEELCFVTGLNPSTVRPRRLELGDKGLIRRAEFTRDSLAGRSMTVWIATP